MEKIKQEFIKILEKIAKEMKEDGYIPWKLTISALYHAELLGYQTYFGIDDDGSGECGSVCINILNSGECGSKFNSGEIRLNADPEQLEYRGDEEKININIIENFISSSKKVD